MRAGDTFECDFLLPAPRLGPPVAHLGEAIVAWALEVRWDVAMGEDPWVATGLDIEQNPDLIAAGVGRQGGLSMLDMVTLAEGATIGVANPKPVATGSPIRVTVAWPGAPDGDARIELHRRISAPNGGWHQWPPPAPHCARASRPTSTASQRAPRRPSMVRTSRTPTSFGRSSIVASGPTSPSNGRSPSSERPSMTRSHPPARGNFT